MQELITLEALIALLRRPEVRDRLIFTGFLLADVLSAAYEAMHPTAPPAPASNTLPPARP